MSGELAPDRRGLRASHEDRDQAVEQLRVAAGDGRLTAEELDERLERALTARTYGELDMLLADLPHLVPGPVPVAGDILQMRTRGGRDQREGPWPVPRRMEVEVRGGRVTLDFTRAVISVPALDLAVDLRGGRAELIVPPEVAVDVGSMDIRGGKIRQRVHHQPGTPLTLTIGLSGSVRGSKIIIRGPRQPGRWARLLRGLARR